MTDEELTTQWLKENKPKVFEAVKDVYEPYTGKLASTNVLTAIETNQWGNRIWKNLGKTFITEIDESTRDFGE